MKLTAQQVYDRLVNDDKILEIKGRIKFHLGNVDITVKQKDVVGNIIQEWLEGWLKKNNIEYALCDNTQMPPDFFLNPDDLKNDLLEVKAFNRSASPGFDIADFRMYEEEIVEKPWMLGVDYIIFGYDMSDEGDVTVKDLWLKKVWQITRRMDKWPLNLQVKQNVVHKIRPGIWYGQNRANIPMFKSLEHFISAVEETMYQNPKTHEAAAMWRGDFVRSYEKHYGVRISVPRWSDIKDEYDTTI